MRQRGVEKLLTCALYGPCLSSCNRRVTVKPHRAREGVRVKDGWMEDHLNPSKSPLVVKSHAASDVVSSTGLGKRVVPRLRELVPRGQRESGGGIHATKGPLFCPALYILQILIKSEITIVTNYPHSEEKICRMHVVVIFRTEV